MVELLISQHIIVILVFVQLANTQLSKEHIEQFKQNGVEITDDNNYWIFHNKQLRDHDYIPGEAVYIVRIAVPKQPRIAPEPVCLPKGTIALASNGFAFEAPYTEDGYNAVEGDAAQVFDSCNGHSDSNGWYHFHTEPTCLTNASMPDQLLGVALDGFPIFGALTLADNGAGRIITSSDLDICHGWIRDGTYEYRITSDFPYVLGCYKGIIERNGRDGESPEDVDNSNPNSGSPQNNQPPPPPPAPPSDLNGRLPPADFDYYPSGADGDTGDTDANGRDFAQRQSGNTHTFTPRQTTTLSPAQGEEVEEDERQQQPGVDEENPGNGGADNARDQDQDQDQDVDAVDSDDTNDLGGTRTNTNWSFCYAVCKDPALGCPEDKHLSRGSNTGDNRGKLVEEIGLDRDVPITTSSKPAKTNGDRELRATADIIVVLSCVVCMYVSVLMI